MASKMSTLCYIERDGKYLMLHRTVKKHDVNKDKWIGVGGHFEADESPDECLLREVREETGYTLTSWQFRGIVTFVSGDGVTEYMHLFTSEHFRGTPIECDEGELEWVERKKVWDLNLWEGDRIFFRLMDDNEPFFSLKLVYNGKNVLNSAVLNGRPMELLSVLNEDGTPSGIIKERGVAHRDGSLHAAVHIWIARENDIGSYDLLLQRRTVRRDAYSGCFDLSAQGHLGIGEEPEEAALRELEDKLGLFAEPEDLQIVGTYKRYEEENFDGRIFRNREISSVYVYTQPLDLMDLSIDEEQIESVRWMGFDECAEAVQFGTIPNCISIDELNMVGDYLKDCFQG